MTEFEINRSARVTGSYATTIDAEIHDVWSTLTDLANWPAWNTAVGRIVLDGPVAVGTRFRWTVGGLPVQSRIMHLQPEREIGWTGTMPGVSARHVWRLTPGDHGTELTTEESFEGTLPWLLPGRMRATLANALRQGVRDLQFRCELGRYREAS